MFALQMLQLVLYRDICSYRDIYHSSVGIQRRHLVFN